MHCFLIWYSKAEIGHRWGTHWKSFSYMLRACTLPHWGAGLWALYRQTCSRTILTLALLVSQYELVITVLFKVHCWKVAWWQEKFVFFGLCCRCMWLCNPYTSVAAIAYWSTWPGPPHQVWWVLWWWCITMCFSSCLAMDTTDPAEYKPSLV